MYFSTRSADIGYGQGQKKTKPSGRQRMIKLRSLEEKGVLKIVEKSHKGTLLYLYLPSEINGLIKDEDDIEINIENIDFYKDRKYAEIILERENYRCFYTGKKLSLESCYLDHVIAMSEGGNNSYRNIVASSYDSNSMKNNKNVHSFLRELYKEEILTLDEFKQVNEKIVELQNGEIKPNLNAIRKIYSC
jgi:hypothetical protein